MKKYLPAVSVTALLAQTLVAGTSASPADVAVGGLSATGSPEPLVPLDAGGGLRPVVGGPLALLPRRRHQH
ncbi:hypothetical protein [Pseudarthrobacter sp. PS3-L1]|uniref:hypothetical protein n=1 Tax=Pseudarthrobacter sp. PS3-L1 TaxID=3046207 RepID=UPI0024BBE5AE|nr:hypothetical protein [Pseudarthrobacter sp. PS3-L1]MDJ0320697.1 hypothetical protein [Pseudarthrobacter sp. PS3-L1]